MKKIITIAFTICISMAVWAQHGHINGGSRVIVVSPAFGFGYSPFYYSPFGSPFGYPYGYPYRYNTGYGSSSRLETKIEDIRTDYHDKIKSARQDASLSHEDRKKIVKQLKADRDKSIHDLKANYYKPQKPAPAVEDKSSS